MEHDLLCTELGVEARRAFLQFVHSVYECNSSRDGSIISDVAE